MKQAPNTPQAPAEGVVLPFPGPAERALRRAQRGRPRISAQHIRRLLDGPTIGAVRRARSANHADDGGGPDAA